MYSNEIQCGNLEVMLYKYCNLKGEQYYVHNLNMRRFIIYISEIGLVVASAVSLDLSSSKYVACSLLPILALSIIKICKRINFSHPNEAHSCSILIILRLTYT